MQVFRFIGDIIEASEARSDVEIDMGDEAVLCRMKTDRGGGWIAVQYAKIDIGER